MGSHAIFCYDREQGAAQVFKSYLQGGLGKDEAVHLLAPNHEVYVGFLRSAGVDIESLEKDRRLGCVLISDCIVDKGRLSRAKAFQTATTLSQGDRKLGFKGTRTITLAEYHPAYVSPSDLLRYENELGRTFESTFNTATLCLLNVVGFSFFAC
ncbi:MAG: MEDS domain-containing protein [Candidatus Bathyarchaeia archaeon]